MGKPSFGSTRMVRAPDCLWRRVLDGLLLLPAGVDAPLHISRPGDLVWLLLAGPATMSEIASDLAAFYEVDAATVQDDLEPIITHFSNIGVIQAANNPQPE